ncbi:hypothetical protein V5O48_015443 [Marasmius crinis-equi]|uniref:Uncharacterized protein n=1 Tax=Marasmius crinis-equi TaxID=585013 RepID=A0ABR3EUJ1_9AGAR
MFATKLFAAFTFATFGLVASTPVAAPVPVVDLAKRDNSDILQVFTTLKGSTDTILPQLNELASNGTASDDTVTPLINQLTDALDLASTGLEGLQSSSSRKRQSDDEIASLVAGMVTEIGNTLATLETQVVTIPALPGLLPGIDASLSQVLRGLSTLLAGVLNLVATLLVDVAALLRNLALGLTLGALGL